MLSLVDPWRIFWVENAFFAEILGTSVQLELLKARIKIGLASVVPSACKKEVWRMHLLSCRIFLLISSASAYSFRLLRPAPNFYCQRLFRDSAILWSSFCRTLSCCCPGSLTLFCLAWFSLCSGLIYLLLGQVSLLSVYDQFSFSRLQLLVTCATSFVFFLGSSAFVNLLLGTAGGIGERK